MKIDYTKAEFSDADKAFLLQEARHVRQKYPDRIPVIVTSRSKDLQVDKHKYLVPSDLTMGQFIYVLRKRVKVKPEQAIFVFINNIIPPSSSLMSTIYTEHVDPNIGMLKAVMTKENTFGKK